MRMNEWEGHLWKGLLVCQTPTVNHSGVHLTLQSTLSWVWMLAGRYSSSNKDNYKAETMTLVVVFPSQSAAVPQTGRRGALCRPCRAPPRPGSCRAPWCGPCGAAEGPERTGGAWASELGWLWEPHMLASCVRVKHLYIHLVYNSFIVMRRKHNSDFWLYESVKRKLNSDNDLIKV